MDYIDLESNIYYVMGSALMSTHPHIVNVIA